MKPEQTARLLRDLDELVGPVDGDDPKVRKRVRILDAALALFVRQGYRKTSMDEVAREAGVAKGTLYLYFAKKVDLMLAAIAREKKAYVREMMDVFDDALPASHRLRKWCHAVLLAPSKMPLSRRLLQGDELKALYADMPPAMLAQQDHYRDTFLVPLIAELAGDHTWTEGELRDRANAVLALVSSAFSNDHVLQVMSAERYAEIVADIIVEGLTRKDKS